MGWSWAVDGVSDEMPRITGPECSEFLNGKRKILETILIISLGVWVLKWGIVRIQPINLSTTQSHPEAPPPTGKQILLILMTFVFGMEMGFKFSTKTVIFILNPCHITTIIQIYLLVARPSKTTTALFRIQMNYLNGPLLAYLFPEVDSRVLPLEQMTYWLQHGLMFIIPIYLLRLGGTYQMEDFLDFSWNIIAYTILIIYHFAFLQPISEISSVNLNHMLCAATSDPFEGSNYRMFAVIHQAILCPFLAKLFYVLFKNSNHIQLDVKIIKNQNEIIFKDYEEISDDSSSNKNSSVTTSIYATGSVGHPAVVTSRIDEEIMTTKID